MKKNLFVALAFAACATISTASAAAPPKQFPHGKNIKPKSNLPQVQKKPNVGKKSNKKAPATSDAKSGGYSGVVQSMKINKDGEIATINLKRAGSQNTVWIKGCGAKSADHPLLNWAFQEKRLVHFFANDQSCFVNVDIPR